MPNVELHEGLSDRVLCAFPDHYFDWVYIDAGHHYEAVRSDATNAAHKVKPDGLLIFNDYIIWSHLEGCAYGVVTVVNEMCRNEGWEMRGLLPQSRDVLRCRLEATAVARLTPSSAGALTPPC